MRKYTRTDENARVLSPGQTKAVGDELKRLDKSSARDLTDSERESVQIALDESDSDQ